MATVLVPLAQGVEELGGHIIDLRHISQGRDESRHYIYYLKPKRVPKRIRLRSRLYGSRLVVELPKP